MAAAKQTAATIETYAADAQKAVTEQVEKTQKSLESVSAFHQDNIEAFLKSQNVAAKAAEELQAELIAFSKKSVEEGVAHAKDLGSAQTVAEFVEKQAAFARTSFDSFVRQSTRLNELFVSAAKDAAAPLNARATASVETFRSSAA